MTNVPKAKGLQAPMDQFINVPRYPPADLSRRLGAECRHALFAGWLDLAEPKVFSHPDMGKRFYLFEMVDLWMTDYVDSPSKRTAGGEAANYLFTGPGWSGDVPTGMKHIAFATRYMAILGPHLCGRHDTDYHGRQPAAGAVQDHAAVAPGASLHLQGAAGDRHPGFSMTDEAARRRSSPWARRATSTCWPS